MSPMTWPLSSISSSCRGFTGERLKRQGGGRERWAVARARKELLEEGGAVECIEENGVSRRLKVAMPYGQTTDL